MAAGLRRDLVTFQTATVAQDIYGAEVETWADVENGQAYARIFWGRGDERRQAAVEQGAQAATFVVLDTPMTRVRAIKDRIAFDGTWDIVGIAKPKRGEIEFSAVRAA